MAKKENDFFIDSEAVGSGSGKNTDWKRIRLPGKIIWNTCREWNG